jgi:hypothetical protein
LLVSRHASRNVIGETLNVELIMELDWITGRPRGHRWISAKKIGTVFKFPERNGRYITGSVCGGSWASRQIDVLAIKAAPHAERSTIFDDVVASHF